MITQEAISKLDLSDLSGMELGGEVVDPMVQKELDWLEARKGKLTCSKFGDLISTGRAKNAEFSQTGYAYLRLKLAERLGSWHNASSKSMEWGKDNEAGAIAAYEQLTDQEVDNEPFRLIHHTDWIAGTPDGLVGDDGCVEAKCPFNPSVHIATAISGEVPKEYTWQVHGHLLVTGRQWCDFMSFDPRIEEPAARLVVIRVERNEVELASLEDRLLAGCEWIDRQLQKIWQERVLAG